MANAGQTLLGLIAEKLRGGYTRPAAEAAVFAAHPDLVRAWHEPQRREEPQEVDPGSLLLACTAARVRLGMSRDRAQQMALVEFPALAAAYHLGQMIPNSADKVGAPKILYFRAQLDGDVAGDTLLRVAIFKAGVWNGRRYSTADLDAMIAANDAQHFEVPLKVGHNEAPDVPAVGRVDRLWREGDTLFADFAGIDPEAMAGIRTGKWLTLSCEIIFGMERDGRKYKAALRGVSLLGGHAPGVDLPPLREAVAA